MNIPTDLAPILIFTYKRYDTLYHTISALQKNILAKESCLFIFSDSPKTSEDLDKVIEVRKFVKNISGFKEIVIHEADENTGLANSIINGVSQVINNYGKAIVLEDDLVTSENFIMYMNQALDYYLYNEKIFSISGFTMPLNILNRQDIYFTMRASSWGWATWKDRWNVIDWTVHDYLDFKSNSKDRVLFNKMGSDLSFMLDRQMAGKINSWAIRWCYHQFKHGLYTVYPATSKVLNIGLETPEATHTNERYNRFKTTLDTSDCTVFNFHTDIKLDEKIIKQFVRPYSVPERIKYKILNTLFS
ncbi:hypothetical protein ACFSUS_09110 [Spirosoma soli]|uniref:Sugar transferase n=1 Tax=Spirosoma soli TaxID=1770529 RepID=A0ABW5M2B1_9BACT